MLLMFSGVRGRNAATRAAHKKALMHQRTVGSDVRGMGLCQVYHEFIRWGNIVYRLTPGLAIAILRLKGASMRRIYTSNCAWK